MLLCSRDCGVTLCSRLRPLCSVCLDKGQPSRTLAVRLALQLQHGRILREGQLSGDPLRVERSQGARRARRNGARCERIESLFHDALTMRTSTTGCGVESRVCLLIAGISSCVDFLSPSFASRSLVFWIIMAALALALSLVVALLLACGRTALALTPGFIVAFLLARGRAAVAFLRRRRAHRGQMLAKWSRTHA